MKKQTINENWVFTTLLTITILSGAFLSLPSASADVVDTVTITVPKACSMSSTLSSAHSTEINNGQYQGNIGETVIKATCNDAEGFSIYAIGFTDDEYGKTVLTSSLGEAHNIITGTAESGNISNWAMKLSPVDGAYAPSILSDPDGSYSNYHIVPETYTKVATRTSGTDLVVGASLKTTYAAYISGTQSAGTYEGKVKYTLVHPANAPGPLSPEKTESGYIGYYPGFIGSGSSNGSMGKQEIPYRSESITLLASNFSREGYGFAGWSDKIDYKTNPNAKFYGPNETIYFSNGQYSGTNDGLSLYAVWIESEGSLQDSGIVASICSNLIPAPTDGSANISSVSALTDARDNQTYAIARLSDGKCWMIENVRLEAESTNGVEKAILSQGYSNNFTGLASSEAPSVFSDISTTSNSLYMVEGDSGENKNIISGDNQSHRFPRYNNYNTSYRPTNPSSNADESTYSGGMYSYGNYYTWSAVIADTSDYVDENHNTTSICPSGWRIPTGDNLGEFYSLNTAINSGTNNSEGLRSYPANFIYSGYIYNGIMDDRGLSGYYWSSTPRYSTNAYYLSLRSNQVGPGTGYGDKAFGRSIRCLTDI